MKYGGLKNLRLRNYKKINFQTFKKIFLLLSVCYFFIYFFKNFDQISFNLDYEKDGKIIFLSFLFCIVSIFFNALAWKNIVVWFGNKSKKHKLISFYVITNILKYVPGGFWHFYERFNYIKSFCDWQLAFYSTLIEPYFMLCASFLLASLGIIFSPIYFLLLLPSFFLNRKLIYLILRSLESLKSKTISALKSSNLEHQSKDKIQLISFFPFKALIIEVLFVFTKFLGLVFCLRLVNLEIQANFIFLLVTFCLAWAIGLVVPTAPGGVGVFEASFLFLVGRDFPQNHIIVGLIYFRLISTSADLLLGLPFFLRRLLR